MRSAPRGEKRTTDATPRVGSTNNGLPVRVAHTVVPERSVARPFVCPRGAVPTTSEPSGLSLNVGVEARRNADSGRWVLRFQTLATPVNSARWVFRFQTFATPLDCATARYLPS